MKASPADQVGGVIRIFRLWFFEGGCDYRGDHPEELLSCSVEPFGSGAQRPETDAVQLVV